MNWADEHIAGQLGFTYCVLFPRAREAIYWWIVLTSGPVNLLTNICPEIIDYLSAKGAPYEFHGIDETGLAPGITTQLYGYREEGDGKSELDLDPLGTGFFARPCATSAIVSFGEKKFITVGGGAFVTSDQGLAEEMESRSPGFPPAFEGHLKLYLAALSMVRDKRRDKVYLWDRHLGDCLERIKREQIIPWRVMRLCPMGKRQKIVRELREAGHDVGTNYGCLPGYGTSGGFFGDRVLNFFVSDDYDEPRVKAACEIIKGALRD